jgi:hypothetical protein
VLRQRGEPGPRTSVQGQHAPSDQTPWGQRPAVRRRLATKTSLDPLGRKMRTAPLEVCSRAPFSKPFTVERSTQFGLPADIRAREKAVA